MVKITNGVNVFEVSKGAYEGIYKHQGYVLYGTKKVAKKIEEVVAEIPAEEPAEEVTGEESQEPFGGKPLSQWSKAEVKEYAEQNGIDLQGTKNVNDAKDRIKAFMEEQEAADAE